MISQVLISVLSWSYVQGLSSYEYSADADDSGSMTSQPYLYTYQPRTFYYFPNDINKVIYQSQGGVNPQYQNLVYNYVKDFAGTEPPVFVETVPPNIFSGQNVPPSNENFATDGTSETYVNEGVTMTTGSSVADIGSKPGLKNYFLPSDLLSLPNHPNNQFQGQIDAINLRDTKADSRPTSLPPIGGAISNYVLLRNQGNHQNVIHFPKTAKEEETLQHIKRETPDDDDSVIILAEPLQNAKNSAETAQHKENDNEESDENEEQTDTQPGVAQSKPSAIALAGPGGVAQASPIGTALVGPGGLAVSAPTGTAVAGPAGQGALPTAIGT